MTRFPSWRIEKRLYVSPTTQTVALLLALAAAFLASAVLIASADASVPEALLAFARSAFGDWGSVAETLVQSTPLIFTALAVTVAFHGKVWNIGAEGQFFAGAMAAAWAGIHLEGWPPALALVVVVLVSILAGAAWGIVPGFLKARYRTNEVIVTVMMNYIILNILSYLLSGPWRDPNSYFLQTAMIADSAYFPRLFSSTRLHAGFVLSLAAAALVYVVLWKTVLGYEIRAFGHNAWAARYKGINVNWTVLIIMAISGALAGLAGGSEIAGLHYRLRLDISTGYGYTGIIIALLARLHPLWAVLTAILFGALINGSLGMQITTGVPVALVYAIQGMMLIAVLTADVLARYRIRRVTRHG